MSIIIPNNKKIYFDFNYIKLYVKKKYIYIMCIKYKNKMYTIFTSYSSVNFFCI